MDSYSVIVTAHNMERLIDRTLQTVETCIEAFSRRGHGTARLQAEIIVVDDGSSDGTRHVVDNHAAGKSVYRLIHHETATSPSCARNAGVNASSGAPLFFLDGDDLFYPNHILVCQQALADPQVDFVKTRVHLADPVHDDWRTRINHSLVINLCVRRSCHDAVGGFPDYHLFARRDGRFHHETDLFFKFEDMYYNELIARLFRGVGVARETVEYVRHPGNAFDRQYAKFQLPFAHRPQPSEEDNFRLHLCDAILEHRLHCLRQSLSQGSQRPQSGAADRSPDPAPVHSQTP
ncbi:MAG TPA: glycosyltransferase family A protein [Gemmataceae bacterium]|nr:glycosyltransferase family A protein [Gemmataceae bacterium]